jgi:hypothetical protein
MLTLSSPRRCSARPWPPTLLAGFADSPEFLERYRDQLKLVVARLAGPSG